MEHYITSQSVENYGAAGYLKGLRARFLSGGYSRERFVYLAARTYMLIDKPKRAVALLESLDAPITSSDYNGKLLELTLKLRTLEAPAYPTCSLNMIAKNEAGNIACALESIDDIMDEIVVCDTGSVDSTREIASLFGAVVVSAPWKNDFSAARNRAISASGCSSIFWMDADDVLDGNSKAHLVNLWRSAGPIAAAMRVACRQDNCGMGEFMQVRLFPRSHGLRFERRVHEQIMFSLRREGICLVQCPWVRIVHTGYASAHARKTKALRNEPLIVAELRDHPEDPALQLNYGDCLMTLERWDDALATYLNIARNQTLYAVHPEVFVQSLFNIACILFSKKAYGPAIKWLNACLNLDPSRTEALLFLGRSHEAMGDMAAALDNFVAAARGSGKLRQTATNEVKIKIQSIYQCARLLLLNEKYGLAEELLTHATLAFPTVVEYHTLLGRAAFKQNKLKEAAMAFMRSLSLSPHHNTDAYIGMALVYARMHDAAKAQAFLNSAILYKKNLA